MKNSKKARSNLGQNAFSKDEFGKYLYEQLEGLDLLCLWKLNSLWFLILTLVARDMVIIPVSEAFESTFN